MEEEFVKGNLINDIARWIVKYQLSKNIRYDLSTILRQHGHPEMSKCIRTLPETQRQVTHRSSVVEIMSILGFLMVSLEFLHPTLIFK